MGNRFIYAAAIYLTLAMPITTSAQQAGHFTVSPSTGFVDPGGQPWSMRGLNATIPEAKAGFGALGKQYPGLTAIRLVYHGDPAAEVAGVIKQYTDAGIVVLLEQHTGPEHNIPLYQQWARTYKNNPLVMLETRNEPKASPAQTAQTQIATIKAVRAEGYKGPIGIQPNGGYDFSHISTVTAAVGTENIFMTPHIYYAGTDPKGAAGWTQGAIQQGLNRGLFSSITEFGNAMDGMHINPQGNAVIDAVMAANEAGKAGALAWSMGNWYHADGSDSAFATPDGSKLTSMGVRLQPWLSDTTPKLLSGHAVLQGQANSLVPAISRGLTGLPPQGDAVVGSSQPAAPAAAPEPMPACSGGTQWMSSGYATPCQVVMPHLPVNFEEAQDKASGLMAKEPAGIAKARAMLAGAHRDD